MNLSFLLCFFFVLHSAFARFPNGDIAHYYCYNKNEKQLEEEEANFKEAVPALH